MRRQLSLLIVAAGALAQVKTSAPSILSFTMEEREAAITRKLGPPEHSSAGTVYRTLDYTYDERNDEDYDWTFYFDQPAGELVSVTRNFAKPVRIDNLLPAGSLHRHTFRNGAAQLAAITRELPGNRLLIAIGIGEPSAPCSQLVLMRRSALARFYPWIDRDLQ